MTLLQQIKDKQLQARKQKDSVTATSLSTLLGEILNIGKRENRESTDTECVSVIKKFLKDLDTMLDNSTEFFTVNNLKREKELLSSFLPKQYTKEELEFIVFMAVDQGNIDSSVPALMQFLKRAHEGKYDGKLAASVVKNFVESRK